MTTFNAPTYNIERLSGACAVTGRKLVPGEHFMATLVETDGTAPAENAAAPNQAGSQLAAPTLGLKRIDVSMEAWQQGHRPEHLFGYWRSVVPEPNQKKRIFVDDEVLMRIFRRLGDADQLAAPGRPAFRFVLALILMRKKLLRYDGSATRRDETGAEQEWWRMVPKGDVEPSEVMNPHLDESQIEQVAQQLGEVLESEM